MVLPFITSGIKAGTGLWQLLKGAGMDPQRPDFNIPQSAFESLDLARAGASSTLLPGQGYYEGQLDRNKAQGLGAARESASNPAQLLEAAMKLSDQSSDGILNLAVAGSERKDRNRQNLEHSLNTMSNWEKLQWEINEFQPYQEKAALKSSLMGAGMQNIFGGLDSMGATAVAKGQSKDMTERLRMLIEGSGKEDGATLAAESMGGGQSMSEALTNPSPSGSALPQSSGMVMDMLKNQFSNWFEQKQNNDMFQHLPSLLQQLRIGG